MGGAWSRSGSARCDGAWLEAGRVARHQRKSCAAYSMFHWCGSSDSASLRPAQSRRSFHPDMPDRLRTSGLSVPGNGRRRPPATSGGWWPRRTRRCRGRRRRTPSRSRRRCRSPRRDRLAQLLVREVVSLHPLRVSARPPLAAAVLVLPDEFLLLSVHADHRLPRRLMLAHLVVDIAELGVAVRVLGALDLLGRGLQAVAGVVDGRRTSHSLHRCPRPVSAADSCRVDLIVHRSGDSGSPRVSGSTRRSSAAVSSASTVSARLRPAPARRTRPESVAPLSSCPHPESPSTCRPGRARHHRDPAPPGLTRLHRHPQPALPLIQHRRQQRKLADTSLSRSAAVTTSHRVRQKS